MNATSPAGTLFASVCLKYLFLVGEYGDKFYVILEGTVSVLVPQKKKPGEEPPPVYPSPKGPKKNLVQTDEEKNRPPSPVSMYEVAVLGKGKHFGELALTTNKPRAATVKC